MPEKGNWRFFLDEKAYKWAFIAIILLGLVARADLWLLPTNDELLYAAGGIQKYLEYTGHTEYAKFYEKDLVEVHPMTVKLIISFACFSVNCIDKLLNIIADYWIYAIPIATLAEFVKPIMPLMRAINVLLSILLAAIVWLFTKKEYGKLPALVAFLIAWLSPNIALYSNTTMLEVGFALFFVASALFYASVFYNNRSWKNAAILAALLSLHVNTKQFLPLLLYAPIILMEIAYYLKARKIDFKVLLALFASGVAYNFVASKAHLTPATSAASTLGVQQSIYFNLQMPLLALAKLEFATLLLLPVAVFLAWKSGELQKLQDSFTGRLAIILALITLPFFFFGTDRVAMRYALPNFVLAGILASYSLKEHSQKLLKLAAFAGVVMALYAVSMYPYYDNYSNPLGYLIAHPGTERFASLPVLSFVHSQKATLVTNDFYSFPYYPKIHSDHILSYGLNYEICNKESAMYGTLVASERQLFAYRLFDVQVALTCPKLKFNLDKYFKKIYADGYYDVYDLRQKIHAPATVADDADYKPPDNETIANSPPPTEFNTQNYTLVR